MIPYCLTRLLYAVDEVYLSLLTALLERRDLDECYYWAAEIWASGFDLIAFAWTIYLDFYAELNPRLEGYIRRKGSEKGGFKAACGVIRNLHRGRPTATVFVARQAHLAGVHNLLERGQVVAMPGFPETHHAWLSAIGQGNMAAAASHLYALSTTWWPESLFRVLVEYHVQIRGASVKAPAAENYWRNRPGHDDIHHIMAIMVGMEHSPDELEMRRVFVAPTDDALVHLNDQVPFGRPDKRLSRARRYGIDPGIGAFALARNKLGDPLRALRMHWEYFAYRCPLWRERLHESGGRPNDVTGHVDFRSDEGAEAFYELHGLEPDEQPMYLQALGTSHVGRESAASWLERTFGTGDLAWNLPDSWKFTVEIEGRSK